MRIKKFDLIWFVYFSIMFSFYTYTYIQLAAQLLLLVFVFPFCSGSRGFRIKKGMILEYVLWIGSFTIWCALTNRWKVYPKLESTNTLLTIFRIFVMGLAIVVYVSKTGRLRRLLKTFVYAGAGFAVLTILSNPVSNWGHEIFLSFDGGFMRNGIANFGVYLLCIMFIDLDNYRLREKIVLALFFLIIILLSGSRRAILELVFIAGLYALTMKNVAKRIKYIAAFVTIGTLAILIAYNIPFLRDTYINRIIAMIDGVNSSDSSVAGRNAYIIIGMRMIEQRPFIGWGIDAFSRYLGENPYAYSSKYFLRAVYSHNNYIEILVSFGIIGLVMFYQTYIRMLITALKKWKQNQQNRMLLIMVIVSLVGDYGGISFSTHISMYIIIFMFCLYNFAKRNKSIELGNGIAT